MTPGETKAWEALEKLDPGSVCKAADASFFAESREYALVSFGTEYRISLPERRITSTEPKGELFLGRLAYFFRLSILWYMVMAKEIPGTGRLVKPEHLKGGQIFFMGTHVLPLDKLAERYDKEPAAFLERGKVWGGIEVGHGDGAVRIMAFPRIPVNILLWRSDDEFPARADLLFDSSCEILLPLDVLWSIAMATLLAMLA